MKKIFKNKKKLTLIIVLLIIVLFVGTSLLLKLTDKGEKVETATVQKGDVNQYYDTTGTLKASSAEKYYAYEGLVPKTVNVEPGDTVCKGDILATFDTSVMNSLISEKKQAYEEALESYNNAVSNKNDASIQAKEIDAQIKSLEDAKAKLDPETNSDEIDQIDLQIELLNSQKTLANSGDTDSMIAIYKQNMESAKAAYDAVVKEKNTLQNGIVATSDGKVTDVYVKVGEPYKVVSDSSNSIDISSLLSGSTGDTSSSVDVSTIISALSETNSTGLEKGLAITVDYYDGYTLGFSLGKYDVQIIKKGMPAIITYTDYTYEGEVSYISATATTSTDIVSSMMGGSTTTTSGSVAAEVTITNPDENLIVGFDAKMSILIAEKKDVLTIPVESLTIEDEKTYVFIIEDGVAKKKEISVGASSDTSYEVTKGLTEGDTIILNASKVTEGEKVYAGD